VHVAAIRSPFLDANCYVLAAPGAAGQAPAVIVDPGALTAPAVAQVVREAALQPIAVLLTHGHADHLWDAAAVAESHDIPVYLHTEDAFFLDDPLGALGELGESLRPVLAAAGGPGQWRRPAQRRAFTTDQAGAATITVGPFVFQALHAPGHSPGSTVFEVTVDHDQAADAGAVPVVLTGDVLFAGSVGRTDLPGGSKMAMRRSLRRLVERLAADSVILPGHGPSSDLAREMAANPFLPKAPASNPGPAPTP